MATISIYTKDKYIRVIDSNDDSLHRFYRFDEESVCPIKSILLVGELAGIEIGEFYVREIQKQTDGSKVVEMLTMLHSLGFVKIYFSTGGAVWDWNATQAGTDPEVSPGWSKGNPDRTVVVTNDHGEARVAVRAMRHCAQIADSAMIDVMSQLNGLGVFSDNPTHQVTYYGE